MFFSTLKLFFFDLTIYESGAILNICRLLWIGKKDTLFLVSWIRGTMSSHCHYHHHIRNIWKDQNTKQQLHSVTCVQCLNYFTLDNKQTGGEIRTIWLLQATKMIFSLVYVFFCGKCLIFDGKFIHRMDAMEWSQLKIYIVQIYIVSFFI